MLLRTCLGWGIQGGPASATAWRGTVMVGVLWAALGSQAGAAGPASLPAGVGQPEVAAGAAVPADDYGARRAALAQQRQALAADLQLKEAQCHQRFLVEDCLRAERKHYRAQEAEIRSREMAINDAERRERARERLRTIQERLASRPPPIPLPSVAPDRATSTPAPGPRTVVREQRQPAASEPRALQAQQRAQEQQSRADAQRIQQQSYVAEQAAQAESARQRQAEREKAAQDRRVRRDQALADREARGAGAPASLPTPPAAPR